MIKAENLVRKYGDFTAVSGVSFEIPKGQIVGLLGHNGAGITTIIKMLTGYLEPTVGEVLVDGHNVETESLIVQSKIGYLPENCPVYPDMTVIDYLFYMAELRGIPQAESISAVKTAIARTALTEKALQPISTLSKGFRQRVGVAQAILHKPEIVILDEPTSGLDPSQISESRSLVKELSKSSTVILSTHILQEVEAICDRVIIILQGQIALDAKLADLQSSQQLLLSCNAELASLKKLLSKIAEINSVQPLEQAGLEKHYRLELSEQTPTVQASIAESLIKENFKLYSLHPERRDLETIFREINSGNQGGKNE
jgi:ABC-2 type transport system ATP-binding protein